MNIIFDLGGVVFDWSPKDLIDRVTDNEKEKELLLEHLLEHSDWIELDRGTITTEEVVQRTIKRSGLKQELIEDIFTNASNVLSLKSDTVKIIEDISGTEHKLYVLSNMHDQYARSLTADFNFWHHFDGIVFSCDVKMVKPERDIYHHILDKYNLTPENTIFIDDTMPNINTACDIGIDGLLFTDPAALKDELIKKGVL